jgi:hypothetical protein
MVCYLFQIMWFVPNSALTDEQCKTMPQEVALRMPDALQRVFQKLNSNLTLTELSIGHLEKRAFSQL